MAVATRIANVTALLHRLVALSTAGRDPVGGIWMAATALAIHTATWVFVGMRLSGDAFSPEERAAPVTLLKVEAGVLLGLFFLLAPRGRRRPGEVDPHLYSG